MFLIVIRANIKSVYCLLKHLIQNINKNQNEDNVQISAKRENRDSNGGTFCESKRTLFEKKILCVYKWCQKGGGTLLANAGNLFGKELRNEMNECVGYPSCF